MPADYTNDGDSTQAYKPEAGDGDVNPVGMRAPAGGATRSRNSFAMSIMRTQCTSSCVFTHSMKRSCKSRGHNNARQACASTVKDGRRGGSGDRGRFGFEQFGGEERARDRERSDVTRQDMALSDGR